jgi:hypothetical protein
MDLQKAVSISNFMPIPLFLCVKFVKPGEKSGLSRHAD